jgi:iron(III) transport system substrate-binding protein
MTRFHLPAALAATFISLAAAPHAEAQGTVNVYSYRELPLIEPLLARFKDTTGVTANIVFAPNGLIERMQAEGRNSPVDVTNESSLLLQAREAGVTQAIKSPVLEGAIPASLRDPEGHWYGLTQRARVIYASKDRVPAGALSYEDLANPKYKGKICTRSGQHPYNVTLIASMIATHGEEKAEVWLRGLKANLAHKPAGGDREQVRDIFAGVCDLAIGNSYYMGAMQTNAKAPDHQKWAAAVNVVFPNASDRGAHVNISGAAVAANAPNAANAVRLLEFLASREAQSIYAEVNHEYPVVADVKASERVQSWGTLKADPRPLAEIVKFRKKASELVDKVGFDAGPGA